MPEKKNRLIRFRWNEQKGGNIYENDISVILGNVTSEDIDTIEDSVMSYISANSLEDNMTYGDFMQMVVDVLNESGYKYQFVEAYDIYV